MMACLGVEGYGMVKRRDNERFVLIDFMVFNYLLFIGLKVV